MLQIWSGDMGYNCCTFSTSVDETCGHPTSMAVAGDMLRTAIGFQYGTVKVYDNSTGTIVVWQSIVS